MQVKKYIVMAVCLLCCLFFFAKCGYHSTDHNDGIPWEVRDEIHAISQKVVEGLSTGDIETLKAIDLDSTITIDEMVEISERFGPSMQGKEFITTSDYQSRCIGFGKKAFPIPSQSKPPFTILIEVECGKSYFTSLMSTQGEHADLSLSLVFVKRKKTWKLRGFYLGQIRIAGRNAVQWYEEAKKMADKNHLLPALLRMHLATGEILRPAPYIQYTQEFEIRRFAKSLQSDFEREHKYSFDVSELQSSPVIYNITSDFVKNDLFPMVRYVTSNSLDDAQALQHEAELMTKALQERFPGITDYYTHIAFKAFSEPPTDPTRVYTTYTVVVEVEDVGVREKR
mgnify:CR=1 FL=1